MTRGFKLFERHYGRLMSRGRGAELFRLVSMVSDDVPVISLPVEIPDEPDPYSFADEERDYLIKASRQLMTKDQAEQLARECDAIIAPGQFGLPKVDQTDVTAMQYRPMRGWIVRFETGTRRTTITELIPADRAVAIHKRSL